MEEKDKLMKTIQRCSFYLTELHLYLDTHPYCQEALDLFCKYNRMNKEAMKEYAEKYGPLTLGEAGCQNKWTWALDEWPWEKGE